MKKRLLSFVFLLLGTLAFVSCQKDNPEDGVPVRPDELAYLQGHFAGYDDEGELQCWAGWQLNEADPGELSMMADSYEAAAAIFKKIILPEAKVEESENSLIWHLTGEKLVFESPTAQFNMDAVAGIRPQTDKMMFVIITQNGSVKIPEGFEIAELRVLDNLFSPIFKPLKKTGGVYRLDEPWSNAEMFKVVGGRIFPAGAAVLNSGFIAVLKKIKK